MVLDTLGMSLGEYNELTAKLTEKAKALVTERIAGTRKGMPDVQNYSHSFRVFETVRSLHHWDDPDEEMFIAALLHDVVEDGGVSLQELDDMGFTKRITELVDLCSHDTSVDNKTERWCLMVSRLIKARDTEAWCIKMIDLADNLSQCEGLSEENRRFMIQTKAPIYLRLTEWIGYPMQSYRPQLEKAVNEAKERFSL